MSFDNFTPNPKPKKAKKNNNPTKAQRDRWEEIRKLGCSVPLEFKHECSGRITIHHCGTGGGGTKDHDKVIALCTNHHISYNYGIDGRGKFSKKTWQEHYKTESELLENLNKRLTHCIND